MDVLDMALMWLHQEGGQVAIHDATNSTVARRCVRVGLEHGRAGVMFVLVSLLGED